MSDLAGHVQDYLRLRRALGFKLTREGQVLPQLVAYHHAAGATTLTAEPTIAWARLPQGVQPITWAHRLGAARGFAAYLKTLDPATEIPAGDVFAGQAPRPTPYLWSPADVCRLLQAAAQLRPPLRAATHEAFFGLVAVSGMRLGEAIGLGPRRRRPQRRGADDPGSEVRPLQAGAAAHHRRPGAAVLPRAP